MLLRAGVTAEQQQRADDDDVPAQPGAGQIVAQLAGFAGYSFPRSHAAAFATIVYQHAWLKRYAPSPFYMSLLNHQPMGFWSPAVEQAIATLGRLAMEQLNSVGAQQANYT